MQIGEVFKTNQGYEIEIIGNVKVGYGGKSRVKFLDKYGAEIECSNDYMYNGTLKNPYHPSVFGIGYLGEHGLGTGINNIKSYKIWKHMLERAYDPKYHERFPTYKNVTVCEEWLCFANFDKWFSKNYIEGYHLDKDLMQGDVENKVYSPETCVFLPTFVNSFIINKNSNNTSGIMGVSWNKPSKQWMVTLFDSERKVNVNLGRYDSLDKAKEVYLKGRYEKAEVIKDRVRDLNYLPEHIIQLIK